MCVLPKSLIECTGEACHVIRQVARALHYLHSLDPIVMHRDLKGKNVLVEWDGDNEKVGMKSSKFGLLTLSIVRLDV